MNPPRLAVGNGFDFSLVVEGLASNGMWAMNDSVASIASIKLGSARLGPARDGRTLITGISPRSGRAVRCGFVRHACPDHL